MRTTKDALIDSLALFAVIFAAVVHTCYLASIDCPFNVKTFSITAICWVVIGFAYKVLIR